jgi:hypothetical protein
VTCESQEEFQRYRCLHKYILRLCGIKDSSKKTNCQYVFMEFISLIGFNGSMCYPTIKKTKEIATTLPSESFKGDSDAVCGRTSECMRVGVDAQSSYIFHRIHMHLLRKTYSLVDGKRFSTPAEMFGQSDMVPLCYLLCSGDPNNYRLMKYENSEQNLRKLVALTEDLGVTSEEGLFSPQFLYNRTNPKIVKQRAMCGIQKDEALKFWETNTAYNFTKF